MTFNADYDLSSFLSQLMQQDLFPLPEELEAIPSIRFILHQSADDKITVGTSKIGGQPDLPTGTDWPIWNDGALSFLGQINMTDLQSFPTARLLPSKGLLSFFYHHDQATWGYDPDDEGSWRVIFTDHLNNLVRRDFPDIPEDLPEFNPCICEFHESLQLPGLEPDEDMISIAFSGPTWLEFGDIFNPPTNKGDLEHRILGKANPIQDPEMDLECQLVKNGIYMGSGDGYRSLRAKALSNGAKDWMLLFQLDSDDAANMMWGDVGRLYFWIRKDDLIHRRFDQVWMILQCC